MRVRLLVVAIVPMLIMSLSLVGVSASQEPAWKHYRAWDLESDYCEPNDSFAQACGSLVSGAIHDAYIWTTTDYDCYFVDVGTGGIFEAILRFTPPNSY